MPVLIQNPHQAKPRSYPFEHLITIGRHPGNDVIVKGEDADLFHASVILAPGGGYTLFNQSGRNPVQVLGRSVGIHPLAPGAVFELGGQSFMLSEEPGQAGAEVQVSHELASPDETLAVGARPPEIDRRRLEKLLALSAQIAATLDPDLLVARAMAICMEELGAERGFLALGQADGKLSYRALHGFDGRGNLKVSASMIDQVMKLGRPVLTANAVTDENYKARASVLAYRIKSVMCVPLMCRDAVCGCVYLDNPHREASFFEHDLAFFQLLANQIAVALDNARLHKLVREENQSLTRQLQAQEDAVIRSPAMLAVMRDARKVAAARVPVLILGETGAGKDMVARAIHRFSDREGQLVAINCGAIPADLLESELFGYEKGAHSQAHAPKLGLLEVAHRGTLFLDEIGEMPAALQAKLLRFLQDGNLTRLGGTKPRTLDVRVLAATNRDLKAMVAVGGFRQDLYYRLAGVVLQTIPLRDRAEDIPALANYFLLKFARENNRQPPGLTRPALERMLAYAWPGNINELRNAMQRAALLGNGQTIGSDDLPADIQASSGPQLATASLPTLEAMERAHILQALSLTAGNKKQAALLLGISRDTLHRKLRSYGIS